MRYNRSMHVVVAGGAGYIGSIVVRTLLREKYTVTVLDDLSHGNVWSLPKAARFVEGDIADPSAVQLAIHGEAHALMHFAAKIDVAESMRDPALYHSANVDKSLLLLSQIQMARVRYVVFSSTAAVYDPNTLQPLKEDAALEPVSVYGRTKLIVESALTELAKAGSLSYVALRYFNAAGASLEDGLGEAHPHETHLIPLTMRAVTTGSPLTIFGSDYPTPDGTCIRDYIDVRDLASAHLQALRYLERGGVSTAFNVGRGEGTSVRELLAMIEAVAGKPIPQAMGSRRQGDPSSLVADVQNIKRDLGWVARHSLQDTVESAWRWHTRSTSS